MKIFSLFLIIILASCASNTVSKTEGIKGQAPREVAYFEKLDFWVPDPKVSINPRAGAVREKLHADGGIIIYSYVITSEGDVENVRMERALPEGLITTKELIQAQYIYEKFHPTEQNVGQLPVHVNERLVFLKNTTSLYVPPDEMTDDEVLTTDWKALKASQNR